MRPTASCTRPRAAQRRSSSATAGGTARRADSWVESAQEPLRQPAPTWGTGTRSGRPPRTRKGGRPSRLADLVRRPQRSGVVHGLARRAHGPCARARHDAPRRISCTTSTGASTSPSRSRRPSRFGGARQVSVCCESALRDGVRDELEHRSRVLGVVCSGADKERVARHGRARVDAGTHARALDDRAVTRGEPVHTAVERCRVDDPAGDGRTAEVRGRKAVASRDAARSRRRGRRAPRAPSSNRSRRTSRC